MPRNRSAREVPDDHLRLALAWDFETDLTSPPVSFSSPGTESFTVWTLAGWRTRPTPS